MPITTKQVRERIADWAAVMSVEPVYKHAFEIAAILTAFGLILNIGGYILFHTLAEFFVIAIGAVISVIAWNSRKYLDNNYLIFLGISQAFSAALYMVHALAYKEMNVFPQASGENLELQIWLAAQYLQAGSFLAAPFFLGRRLRLGILTALYTAATSLLLLAIFQWKIFPVAHLEKGNPTAFYEISELAFAAVFLLSLVFLLRKRAAFEKRILNLIVCSIILLAATEAFFAFYDNINDFLNTAGHLARLVAMYFLYEAIIVTSFKNPYGLLLRNIKKKEDELRNALNNSEAREVETKALLQSTNEAMIHPELKEAIKFIFAKCRKTIGASAGYVSLIDKTNPSGEKELLPGPFKNRPLDGDAHPILASLKERARQSQKPVYGNRLPLKYAKESAGVGGSYFPENALVSPLIVHDDAAGYFVFFDKLGGFTENDSQLVSSFSKIASVTLHNIWTTAELESSRERFRSLTQAAQDAIIVADNRGIITYLNKSAERTFDYKKDELNGKPIELIMPTIYAEMRQNELAWFQDENQQKVAGRTIEVRCVRKNGEVFPSEISTSYWKYNNEKFYGVVIRDITRRKKNEEAIQKYAESVVREQAWDEALLLGIADGVIATDAAGNITFVNRAIEKLSGLNHRNLLGKKPENVLPLYYESGKEVPPEKRPLYAALASESKKNLSALALTTFYYRRADGKQIPLSISGSPFVFQNKIAGAIVVWHDRTEQQEVDRAKTEFISFASHQLRTPLTSVSLAIDILLNHSKEKLTSEQRKYLKMALSGTKNMSELINTLLDISRIQMGTLVIKPEPVDLAKFIDEILNEMSVQFKAKKCIIKKNYHSRFQDIMIDRRSLKIVFDNIISNAMKYSPAESAIFVEIEKKKNDVLISVSDTGYGIPADQQSKIFDRLFRVTNYRNISIKGSGLGLYLAKAIVEQYGGQIWCASPSKKAFLAAGMKAKENCHGTTFYVTVPLSGMTARIERPVESESPLPRLNAAVEAVSNPPDRLQ